MSSHKPREFVSLLKRFSKQFKLNCNNWLEIGCGNGNVTYFLNQEGFKTIGIDVEFKKGPFLETLIEEKKIIKIKTPDDNRSSVKNDDCLYKWPCKDNSISFCFSSSVLEHVINPRQFVSENARILNKKGFALHYLPSKYALIEPHVGVLFGGVFVNKVYFKLMCNVGLCFKRYRNRGQDAYEYMIRATNYYSKSKLIALFIESEFDFIGEYTKYIPYYLGPKLTKWISKLPILIFLFSIFRSHILIFRKNEKN